MDVFFVAVALAL